jgi:hypothetical protein
MAAARQLPDILEHNYKALATGKMVLGPPYRLATPLPLGAGCSGQQVAETDIPMSPKPVLMNVHPTRPKCSE